VICWPWYGQFSKELYVNDAPELEMSTI